MNTEYQADLNQIQNLIQEIRQEILVLKSKYKRARIDRDIYKKQLYKLMRDQVKKA